jgi:plastocyanin
VYFRTALFTILALVMLATLLAGCSSPTATPAPTAAPTPTPTAAPTAAPTVAPTAVPNATPTATPTAAPTATPAPTVKAPPAPQSASEKIQNLAFDPQVTKIAAGGSVTWSNQDGMTHTVTFSDSTQTISNGGSYTKKFDTPGTYAYHCSIHPSMTGTVEVT